MCELVLTYLIPATKHVDQNLIKCVKIANKLSACTYQIACYSTTYNHTKLEIVSNYCSDNGLVIYGLV